MSYAELSEPLYHGSEEPVSDIDLTKSVPNKDFGRGFYTTNDSFQAEKFAKLKASRAQKEKGYVSVFKVQDIESLKIKKYTSSNEEWFDFVLCNRGYTDLTAVTESKQYDIVIGPVANDAVGVVLNLFVYGTYGDPNTVEAKETAIRLLLAQKLHNQVFFGTELAVSCLSFLETYDVHID
jgi:hypothetical protein